jgi:hypothetical protein
VSARVPCVRHRGALLAAFALTGCIIPDSGIIVRGDFDNEGAVRIVEPISITERASQSCGELETFNECPNVPDTLPTGLVRQNLCRCSEELERDANPLSFFQIFVEDPDVEADGTPSDQILAAFLLDISSNDASTTDFLAYRNYLSPEQPADLYTGGDTRVIERADPGLRSWVVGQDSVDLCNDNEGSKAPAGVHELRVVVTDRPWFRPPMRDANGAIVRDDEGEPLLGEPIFGVPDLPGGATYDTRSFVFTCGDEADASCSCVETMEG